MMVLVVLVASSVDDNLRTIGNVMNNMHNGDEKYAILSSSTRNFIP
jgi:hypothetical protein